MNSAAVNVDLWSLAALQIEMNFQDTLLSHGTGSIWKSNSRTFLVTNWHNVTGRHRETGRHLSNTAAEPDGIKVFVHSRFGAGIYEHKVLPLFDEQGNKLWLEHPSDKSIDLVAIPIDIGFNDKVTFVNELPTEQLVTAIGADLFIVGYPFKMDVIGLPVWKRATLASEPNLERVTGKKMFFVDTATRSGMSGSLVFRREVGSWTTEDGTTKMTAGSVASKLLGIYSGRLGANMDGDAQLGIVWPTRFVVEILTASEN